MACEHANPYPAGRQGERRGEGVARPKEWVEVRSGQLEGQPGAGQLATGPTLNDSSHPVMVVRTGYDLKPSRMSSAIRILTRGQQALANTGDRADATDAGRGQARPPPGSTCRCESRRAGGCCAPPRPGRAFAGGHAPARPDPHPSPSVPLSLAHAHTMDEALLSAVSGSIAGMGAMVSPRMSLLAYRRRGAGGEEDAPSAARCRPRLFVVLLPNMGKREGE
jgi:hypothetical protein